MAKFDFNNTRYAKIFASKENLNFLQTLIDTKGLLGVNYGWWKSQVNTGGAPIPTDASGVATFTQKSRKLEAAPMMDLRAPLGKGLQEDSEGIEWYSATIPHFISTAFVETAPERMVREEMLQQFGNDTDIMMEWIQTVQTKLDSAHQTMNWMTAQLATLGYINYQMGRGIKGGIHKANIPAEHFKTAGDTVWTDATGCHIISVMAKFEQDYRNETGYQGPLVWQMTKNFFANTFLKNGEVKELVSDWRQLNYIANTENLPVNATDWMKAYADVASAISPIEIVEEQERNLTDAGSTLVKGWDDKYVILRPAGKPMDLKKTTPLDIKAFAAGMTASTVHKVFGQANDGLCTIINTTNDNGEHKEWRTEVVMSACPALNDFNNRYIIDVTRAN